MKPHYERIRKVKTKSGATAIQVGSYVGKSFKLLKHLGSSKDPQKIADLMATAQAFVSSRSPQLQFNFNPQSSEILFKRGIVVERMNLSRPYDYLSQVYKKIGFESLGNELLKHLCFVRVLEPASKIRSLRLLAKYFGIIYGKTSAFRGLLEFPNLKGSVSDISINFAKTNLGFDFSLVFYDVTTLYFETFKDDDFRKPGFSKDNKPAQPQILVGLLVSHEGFPVYYDLFPGNTFEGKTIIPLISSIRKRYSLESFTVVADAAMLSEDNLNELKRQGINYVVGARLGGLGLKRAAEIAGLLSEVDHQTVRIGEVIYEYSKSRAVKDKADHDREIKKAEYFVKNPAKIKRSKFLKTQSSKVSLNEGLIKKQRLLEGIKGYRTNVNEVSDSLLVERYHDLWKIEESFRISKSDLCARPVYHRRQESIKAHLLIVFMALCMVRVIEKEKGESIKKVVEDLKDQWTVNLKDTISGNSLEITLPTKPH